MTVTTHHESPYKLDSTYYVLDGDSVTLVCDTGLMKQEVRLLIWSDKLKSSDATLYEYYFDDEESNLLNDFNGRDIQGQFIGTQHRLTINRVNIVSDGRLYECQVTSKQLDGGMNKLDLRNEIMGLSQSSLL